MKNKLRMLELIGDITTGHSLISSELTILDQLEEDFGYLQEIVPIATVKYMNLLLFKGMMYKKYDVLLEKAFK